MNRLASMLGLAKRAGALSAGSNNVVNAIKSGKAKIVLIAADASDNTVKMLRDKSAWRGIKTQTIPLTMAELAHAIGKRDCAAAAITTDDFYSFYGRVSETTNQEVGNNGNNK